MLALNSLKLFHVNVIHQMYKRISIYKRISSYKHGKKYIKNRPIKQLAHPNNIFHTTQLTKLFSEFNNINKTMRENIIKLQPNKEKLNVSVFTKSNIKVRIPCTALSGKIENYKIIDEIIYNYYTYNNMNEICLSDTYGTFDFTNFKIIIDYLIKLKIDFDRIALELHIFNSIDNTKNIENIILYATKNGIHKINIYNMSDREYSNV